VLLTALVNTQQANADDKPNYEPMQVGITLQHTQYMHCRTQLCTVDICSCTSVCCILTFIVRGPRPSPLLASGVIMCTPHTTLASAGPERQGLWQTTDDVSWGEGVTEVTACCQDVRTRRYKTCTARH